LALRDSVADYGGMGLHGARDFRPRRSAAFSAAAKDSVVNGGEVMAAKELVPEVRKPNGSELVLASPTPMDLLQMAINRDLDIDKLAKLLELQKDWEKGEARKAFVEAMNAFKRNPPSITKNKHVNSARRTEPTTMPRSITSAT
jgi:hypothetical protein